MALAVFIILMKESLGGYKKQSIYRRYRGRSAVNNLLFSVQRSMFLIPVTLLLQNHNALSFWRVLLRHSPQRKPCHKCYT